MYLYRPVMAKAVPLIDPAVFTARALYASLVEDGKLRKQSCCAGGQTQAEFFITVPCRRCNGVALTADGWFTYEYKYGRRAGMVSADVYTVPLRAGVVDAAAEQRLSEPCPRTCGPGLRSFVGKAPRFARFLPASRAKRESQQLRLWPRLSPASE